MYQFNSSLFLTQHIFVYPSAVASGDVATIHPHSASEQQKQSKNCARVEIFKMTGGTEYIVHDIDENNTIVGKIRFSGTVRVPDEIAVEGFSSNDAEDMFLEEDDDDDNVADGNGAIEMDKGSDIKNIRLSISTPVSPPTFHPPSFGVTVLGNSHGFDKNGSTSGYVLWINGRGVMIDPPPYSSAALEREGIRPRMIMAIIITHCHADHDAGAFQKVMTGTKVAVITTPTIYKSFIRKYSALSGLSLALLRHSHRHRPAIIGQPLKFQGATFHFTYTLHTIPCIAFRVEWRGRSMVFTGDHMNIPEKINDLESTVSQRSRRSERPFTFLHNKSLYKA
jgi:glyoxylase-like metal-dependent hydrolase (beta-lactamase superfamily II)